MLLFLVIKKKQSMYIRLFLSFVVVLFVSLIATNHKHIRGEPIQIIHLKSARPRKKDLLIFQSMPGQRENQWTNNSVLRCSDRASFIISACALIVNVPPKVFINVNAFLERKINKSSSWPAFIWWLSQKIKRKWMKEFYYVYSHAYNERQPSV